MAELAELTRSQQVALTELADGKWRRGARQVGADTVLSTVAAELSRRGLVVRRGASRTASPRNPGYEYAISVHGRRALARALGLPTCPTSVSGHPSGCRCG